jgi:hypothetical protein
MQEFSYSPEETLISIDVVDDNSLFLINKGEVSILFKDKILKTLKVMLFLIKKREKKVLENLALLQVRGERQMQKQKPLLKYIK